MWPHPCVCGWDASALCLLTSAHRLGVASEHDELHRIQNPVQWQGIHTHRPGGKSPRVFGGWMGLPRWRDLCFSGWLDSGNGPIALSIEEQSLPQNKSQKLRSSLRKFSSRSKGGKRKLSRRSSFRSSFLAYLLWTLMGMTLVMERYFKEHSILLGVGSVDGLHLRVRQLGGVFRFADCLGVGTTERAIAE